MGIGTDQEMREQVESLVQKVVVGEGEAVFTTVDSKGAPHATWMGTLSAEGLKELVTITSPDSDKVANLIENPKVEWMFTDAAKTTIVYLRGEAEVVEDVSDVKRAWEGIEDKGRAYFLDHYNSGMGFAVIRTHVREVELCMPEEFRKERIVLE
ncbi:MAG: pyridoxamine 5'-phosphate oxidase family protein [Verrucomicrobiota bacterium]